MGLSALNAHRHSYNFIPSGRCMNCMTARLENNIHFLFECLAYVAHSEKLIQDLLAHFPNIFVPLQGNMSNLIKSEMCKLLVSGTGTM